MTDTKDTNPKDAMGSTKLATHVVPSLAIAEMALALMDGGCKYGTHNWRVSGVRMTVYLDAIDRHLKKLLEGEDFDRDGSGQIRHLGNIMACCAIILDAQARDKLTDDRPPVMRGGWMDRVNERAAAILSYYPEHKKPYTKEGGWERDANQMTMDVYNDNN